MPKGHLPKLTCSCLTVAIGLLILLCACGSPVTGVKKTPPPESPPRLQPLNLTYESRDKGVFLKWETNRRRNDAISGYLFYVIPEALAGSGYPNDTDTPLSKLPYPGDTIPDIRYETAELKDLENGVTYLGAVRIKFGDGVLSNPTRPIRFTPMAYGNATLVGRYHGENDGFAFATGAILRADSLANDIYFYATAEGDFLASPSRLGMGLRSSKFQKLGHGSSVRQPLNTAPEAPMGETVPVTVGDIVEVTLASFRKARLRVTEISGDGPGRAISFEYVYQRKLGESTV